MEILRGTSSPVKFTVPTDLTTAVARFYRDGEEVHYPKSAVVIGGIASVNFPLALSLHEGVVEVSLSIVYEGDETELKKKISVVTPILEIWEVQEILGGNSSQIEAAALESAVRHIINAHTGQTFGVAEKTLVVRGNGSNTLALPERLVSVTSLNGIPNAPTVYEIDPSGWYLSGGVWGFPPNVKGDIYGIHEINGYIYNEDGVRIRSFRSGQQYTITGRWGWESVPEAVREAAKLLCNDYACGDANYRDRYLTSMTAADWRIQFNSGAFAQTGNVRADQLLEEFVTRRGWGVV